MGSPLLPRLAPLCLAFLVGCASGAAPAPKHPESGPAGKPASEAEATAAADGAPPRTPAIEPPLTTAGMSPPLPDRVDAGTIPRTDLLAVLERGIPLFLRRLEVEPVRPEGRFLGWRLVRLFPREPELLERSVLKPGDIIVRVNNHSVERPEQFKTVWDSLAGGSEIVFDIVRGDHPSRVRYLIGDDDLGTTGGEPAPVNEN